MVYNAELNLPESKEGVGECHFIADNFAIGFVCTKRNKTREKTPEETTNFIRFLND